MLASRCSVPGEEGVERPLAVSAITFARRSDGSSRRTTSPAAVSWSRSRTSDGPSIPTASARAFWRGSPASRPIITRGYAVASDRPCTSATALAARRQVRAPVCRAWV